MLARTAAPNDTDNIRTGGDRFKRLM